LRGNSRLWHAGVMGWHHRYLGGAAPDPGALDTAYSVTKWKRSSWPDRALAWSGRQPESGKGSGAGASASSPTVSGLIAAGRW